MFRGVVKGTTEQLNTDNERLTFEDDEAQFQFVEVVVVPPLET